jgi:hypothetical protein
MGFQPERPPDPRHCRLCQPGLGGHRTSRPVRVAVGRLLLEGLDDQRLDPRITDDPRPARTRLVGQTLEPGMQEPRTPLRDRRARHAEILGDLTDRATLRAPHTIRDRNASACEVLRRRDHPTSTSCSSSDSTNGGTFGLGIHEVYRLETN